MFNEVKEKYIPKSLEILEKCKNVSYTNFKPCTPASYVTDTLRETFKFIKENPYIIEGNVANVYILCGVSILEDESSTNVTNNYATLTISGVVKKVCETYVELEYINNEGETIFSTIAYDNIVYLYHLSIIEYFEEYVNAINSLPPLCYCLEDSKFNLLVKLAKTISNEPDANLKLVLDGVLTRNIAAENIAILRNLVIVEEFFVNPINYIGAFIKVAECN